MICFYIIIILLTNCDHGDSKYDAINILELNAISNTITCTDLKDTYHKLAPKITTM